MVRKFGFIAMFVFAQLGIFQSTPFNLADANAQALPITTGWYDIPNTTIRAVCPPNGFGGSGYAYRDQCNGVTNAWNSAVFDTTRNRLIVWGGGHQDYYGNEMYSLNLNATPITMTRLNNPSTQIPTGCGIGSTGDNQANSRHTYDHIVYMSHIDRMFVFGGASTPCGFMLNDTWTFSFSSMTWQQMNPSGTKPEANYGRVTVYNPTTQKVYIHDQTTLYSYSYESNSYTTLANNTMGQESTGVFDSKRQLFLLIGNGAVYAYDVSASSNFQRQTWNTTGGSPIVNANNNPGVAYDPVSDRIVGWNGGNTVYSLDPTTKVWTATTFPGGPAAINQGTFKRWAYSPASGAFVVVNSVDNDAFALKLAAGSPPTPDTIAPTTPTNISGAAVSPSQITLSWTAATDNVSVTGYRIFRNGLQINTATSLQYSDTGLSPSTTYAYTIAAVDGAGNVSSQSTGASATTLAQSSGGSDFQSRCNASGVIMCKGFDIAADFVPAVWPAPGIYGPDSCTNCRYPVQDTSVAASGASSMKFIINGQTSSNMAGSLRQHFGQSFGNNSTFYVQFALRYDPNLVNINWNQQMGTGWKSVIFHGALETCSDVELTTVVYYDAKFQHMYTDCGGRGIWTSQNTPLSFQQGDYNCDFGAVDSGNTSGCWKYNNLANTWITYYYKVHIGTYGTPSSSIEAWYAINGQPYKKFVSIFNFQLNNQNGASNNYAYATITPYMTSKSQSIDHATAYMWLDDFIVSTQPIVAPGGGGGTTNPPPAAPTNLRVQ